MVIFRALFEARLREGEESKGAFVTEGRGSFVIENRESQCGD